MGIIHKQVPFGSLSRGVGGGVLPDVEVTDLASGLASFNYGSGHSRQMSGYRHEWVTC